MLERITFTSANLNYDTEPDCVMPPDDPIYNGLGAREAAKPLPVITSDKAQYQRQHNIQPGTEAWFRLWFKDAR